MWWDRSIHDPGREEVGAVLDGAEKSDTYCKFKFVVKVLTIAYVLPPHMSHTYQPSYGGLAYGVLLLTCN